MTFHKSTRTDKNAYWETAIVCVKIWNYKMHFYIFWEERVKGKLHPIQPINFCSDFSSTLLVPFAVLDTPAEEYLKSSTVPFTNSDSGNGNNCTPYCTVLYCTVPNRTAQWKRAISTVCAKANSNFINNTWCLTDHKCMYIQIEKNIMKLRFLY